MNEARYREAEGRLWQSKGVTPTERRLHLKRNDVNVRVLEVGEGPPVLFVHGGNVSGSSWAALVARLPGFRCILLDRPGCGLSEPLATTLNSDTLPSFAETLLPDVLDALELDSAHLVATSFGAHLTLRGAAAHPQRIGRIVLFGWPFGASSRLPLSMRITGAPGVARLMAAMPVNERAVRMIYRSIGHGPTLKSGLLTAEDIGWYVSLLRDTDTLRNEVPPARFFFSPRHGLNPALVLSDDVLGRVSMPTQLIWGEGDPFGGPKVARAFVQRLPNARLELLANAGHAPWLDELDRCVETTTVFLTER